jgi:GNAT superfamily N-acetyltransferase
MGITIREADIVRDMPVLRAICNANRAVAARPARFRWLYEENPDGRARAWLAHDDRTGEVAGAACVLPCRIHVGHGRQIIAWNGADFSVNRRYRSLGVAVKLRRAACDAIDQGECSLLFSHPNDRMLPVQLRAGCRPLGRMVRHAKLLGVHTRSRSVRALASAGMRLLGVDWMVRLRHDVEWRRGLPVPEDVSGLFARMTDRLSTAVVRDAAYLDWRFRRHPTQQNEAVILRAGGRVTAYAIVGVEGEMARIKDWLAESPEAFTQLLTAIIRELYRRGVCEIVAVALESHADLPLLRRFGFIKRPDFSTAIAYVSPREADASFLDPSKWYMTRGDRHG